MNLKLPIRADEPTDIDSKCIKEVQVAFKFELEDGVNYAHTAVEVHAKGQNLQFAIKRQVEQCVAGNGLRDSTAVRQCDVVQRTGVDLQNSSSLDVHDGDTHLDIGFNVQREEGCVAGIHAKGSSALDADLTKVAQVQHHVHRSLNAMAVDQQIDRTAKFNRPNTNAGFARNAQHLLVKRHLSCRTF